ncbi:MAG: hypothetical protein BWY54_00957 [Candidatus Dependentiae bacterium ADurb.Bin331]|nr:MAG: hypothetical protein BWY54_00957 [Candidatus Dependentiae bacterium ADurb.Bin331]
MKKHVMVLAALFVSTSIIARDVVLEEINDFFNNKLTNQSSEIIVAPLNKAGDYTRIAQVFVNGGNDIRFKGNNVTYPAVLQNIDNFFTDLAAKYPGIHLKRADYQHQNIKNVGLDSQMYEIYTAPQNYAKNKVSTYNNPKYQKDGKISGELKMVEVYYLP